VAKGTLCTRRKLIVVKCGLRRAKLGGQGSYNKGKVYDYDRVIMTLKKDLQT
jgi:hypothetical protein